MPALGLQLKWLGRIGGQENKSRRETGLVSGGRWLWELSLKTMDMPRVATPQQRDRHRQPQHCLWEPLPRSSFLLLATQQELHCVKREGAVLGTAAWPRRSERPLWFILPPLELAWWLAGLPPWTGAPWPQEPICGNVARPDILCVLRELLYLMSVDLRTALKLVLPSLGTGAESRLLVRVVSV